MPGEVIVLILLAFIVFRVSFQSSTGGVALAGSFC
jgi:hypothetical protein